MALGSFIIGGGLEAYPIGSIYMSMNATDPGLLFGGTWERIKNRFVFAAGDGYEVGATGGEEKHTLTVSEMPSHEHNVRILAKGWSGWGNGSRDNNEYSTSSWNNPISYGGNDDNTAHVYMGYASNAGNGQPHNNMPPYLVAYMWYRTA